MKPLNTTGISPLLRALAWVAGVAFVPAVLGQNVTFAPYIQLGDNGAFGPSDQIVVAWQTDETSPKPSAFKVEFQSERSDYDRGSVVPQGRIVDNYLAADPALPAVPGAYGAHSNYTAVLSGLRYDTVYKYSVTGPGMPNGTFSASFRTRKRSHNFSFIVDRRRGLLSGCAQFQPRGHCEL